MKAVLSGADDSKQRSKRTLTGRQLILLGVSAIVGVGIFVLTGQVAALYAGPGIFFSFLLAALISACAAFCYAELAALIPTSTGAYSYVYVTMGEVMAWTVGWALILEYLAGAAAVAVGWAGYCVSFFKDLGILVPTAIAGSPLAYDPDLGWSKTDSHVNLFAMLLVAVIGGLVACGIKLVTRWHLGMMFVKVAVLVLFMLFGIWWMQGAHLSPFVPSNHGSFGEFGLSGILRGAGVLIFAFLGFDAIASLSHEVKNPQKEMPQGILRSLGISTILYLIIGLVLTGVVSYKLLNVADPLFVAMTSFGTHFAWLRFVLTFGILVGLPSGMILLFLSQSRLVSTMAQDGLLPALLGKGFPTTGTPMFGTLLATLVCMLIGGFLPLGILAQLVSLGTLLIFAFVCFGVLLLRFMQPHLHRPFQVPFVPWVPLAGTVLSLLFMFFLPAVAWMQLFLWMAIGYWIYFVYGIQNSKLRNK